LTYDAFWRLGRAPHFGKDLDGGFLPKAATRKSQFRATWQKHGRSDKWLPQRMTGQETRNKLTDYWATHDIKKGDEYAILTNLIHQEWSGVKGSGLTPFIKHKLDCRARFGCPQGLSLTNDDRAMGGQTNFEFVCPGRMTTARIAFERSSPQMFPSPVLADTLSHRMGEGRG
jgi:hypothetical protein